MNSYNAFFDTISISKIIFEFSTLPFFLFPYIPQEINFPLPAVDLGHFLHLNVKELAFYSFSIHVNLENLLFLKLII